MKASERYFKEIQCILSEVMDTQAENIETAAGMVAKANEDKNNIFAFGCNHAGLLSLELFYRTGGLVTINPIRAPGMMCELTPMTMTSEMERMEDYGKIILKNTPIKKDDILLIHSVSGRNAVTVDMALYAREIGVKVIAITNMNTTTAVSSRHGSGKKLYECADIVIDNKGCVGDACIEIDGMIEKTAPTSTAVGAVIVNAITARVCEIMTEKGLIPPVFVSANLDEGDKHNKKILDEYKNNIFYM